MKYVLHYCEGFYSQQTVLGTATEKVLGSNSDHSLLLLLLLLLLVIVVVALLLLGAR